MEEPWEIEITSSGWRTIKGFAPPIDLGTLRKHLNGASGPTETYADYVSLVEGRLRSPAVFSKTKERADKILPASHERDHNRSFSLSDIKGHMR